MLSILIPIYNQDVRKLVTILSGQCQRAQLPFQILCFDDASKDKYKKVNRQIETAYGVSYIEFEGNMGRAKIRNKLAFNAMYNKLLFLDCDSEIGNKKFIKKYVGAIKDHPVVYGGTKYAKRKPRSTEKMLHWKYGKERELIPVDQRNKRAYTTFRSNNFAIDRDLFLEVKFDESIQGYGHEDTLFAQDLRRKGVNIFHIDNPVVHGGLEKIENYLPKVDESIRNLVDLKKRGYLIETRLSDTYFKIGNWSLLPLMRWLYNKYDNKFERVLNRSNPNLRLLDLYKLGRFDHHWTSYGK